MRTITFHEIAPFVRHVHYVNVPSEILYGEIIPYDHRMFYSFSGRTQFQVNGKNYTLENGSLLVFPPGTPYLYDFSHTEQSVLIGVNFDYLPDNEHISYPVPPEGTADFSPEEIITPVSFSDMPDLKKPLLVRHVKHLERQFIELEQEYRRQIQLSRTMMSFQLGEILVSLVREHLLASTKSTSSNQTVIDIINFIHDNYEKSLSNGDIGEVFNYHPNYINSLLVKVTGKSLHQYLIEIRMARAIVLLETTGLAIHEIAQAVGYKDASYFSRVFRNTTGRRPSDYRKPTSRGGEKK